MIDAIRFSEARLKVLSEATGSSGIGTLSEKVLHKILKLYFEPDEKFHEVSYLGSVADVMNAAGIIEIQTRAFERLVPKLRKFLPDTHVTVVYPIITEKTLLWYDKATGEITEPRKSPRQGKFSDALPELSKISDLIGNENLTVRLVLLKAEEFKSLDGWDKTKKRGATRIDRIPTEITDIIDLEAIPDYARLVPDILGDSFKAKDFEKASKLRGRRAWFSLQLLLKLGILTRESDGRAYIYKRSLENYNK